MAIKNLIERLNDWDGVDAIYNGGFVEVNHYGVSRLLEEAAAALEQLQAENDRLKRERDAAVGNLETIMAYGGGNLGTCKFCKNSQCYARGGTKLCIPEWRGPEGGLTWKQTMTAARTIRRTNTTMATSCSPFSPSRSAGTAAR